MRNMQGVLGTIFLASVVACFVVGSIWPLVPVLVGAWLGPFMPTQTDQKRRGKR